MLNASEAKIYALDQKVSDTKLLMMDVEMHILDACKHGIQWCLVPTVKYSIGAKIRVYRELINVYGYSVTQRNNEQGNCLYIKWGHANVTIPEDKQED